MPGSRMPEGIELARMWHGVVGLLQVEVPAPTFSTWIEGTRPVRVDDGTLYVEARSAFACDSLNEHPLRTMIVRALHATDADPCDVRFVPPGGEQSQQHPRGVAPQGPPRPEIGTLNQRYTFARYVPSASNLVALQACNDIIEEPETFVGPLVIHGEPGLGKTHLLHAVGLRAAAAGRTTACLSAEEFANRYGAAIRGGEVGRFQDDLRQLQVLLIDDLQYLEGRTGMQTELVHTIEAITNAGGHAVIASEQHPARLRLLPRLASRLLGGLVVAVSAPVAGERRCFVEHLAQQQRAALPAWCIDRLAALPAPSVRVIQGAVNAAIALQRSNSLAVEALDATVLASAMEIGRGSQAPDAVLDTIAQHYDVSVADLAGRSRKPALTEARAVAVAALRERGETFTDIGNRLGARSTATLKELNKRGQKVMRERQDLRARIAG